MQRNSYLRNWLNAWTKVNNNNNNNNNNNTQKSMLMILKLLQIRDNVAYAVSHKIPEGFPRWLHLQGNGSCRTQREIIQEPCKKWKKNHDEVVFQFDQTNIHVLLSRINCIKLACWRNPVVKLMVGIHACENHHYHPGKNKTKMNYHSSFWVKSLPRRREGMEPR